MDVEFQLREAGHDVTSVHNVDKAIEILTRQQADVVFTDVDMPGLHGWAQAWCSGAKRCGLGVFPAGAVFRGKFRSASGINDSRLVN